MSRKKINTLLFIITILYILEACKSVPGFEEGSIDGTSWNLEVANKFKMINESQITLSFMDGEVSGSSGCNSYGGTYTAGSKKIDIKELASTMMFCISPEGIMAQEQQYLENLAQVTGYNLDNDTLVLTGADEIKLTFQILKVP